MATYTIGRSDENAIVLSETTVSRQHAELETRKRGSYVLRDLDSTYGTRIFRDGEWLNIIEVEVTDTTEVTFGEYRSTIGEIVAMATGSPEAAIAPAAAGEPAPSSPTPAAEAAPPPMAAPQVAAPQAEPPPTGGTGMDKRTTLMILAGGGTLVLLVIIAAVVILLTGGSGSTTNQAALSPPSTGTRAAFEARLVKGCTRQGRLDANKCQCIARHMSQALTREELAIFVALRNIRGNRDKVSEIVKRYGAVKVAAISTKMIGVHNRMQKQCGVSLNR